MIYKKVAPQGIFCVDAGGMIRCTVIDQEAQSRKCLSDHTNLK